MYQQDQKHKYEYSQRFLTFFGMSRPIFYYVNDYIDEIILYDIVMYVLCNPLFNGNALHHVAFHAPLTPLQLSSVYSWSA